MGITFPSNLLIESFYKAERERSVNSKIQNQIDRQNSASQKSIYTDGHKIKVLDCLQTEIQIPDNQPRFKIQFLFFYKGKVESRITFRSCKMTTWNDKTSIWNRKMTAGMINQRCGIVK